MNLTSDSTCGLDAPTDLQSTDPELAPYGAHLGPSPAQGVIALVPQPGSPAVDSGRTGCSGTDRRGQVRPTDGDGNGAAVCDRGATELGPVLSGLSMTVSSTADAPDDNPGDRLCRSAAGECTLRAAIMEANENNSADSISLQLYAHYVMANSGGSGFPGGSGELLVYGSTTIYGAYATIEAGSVPNGLDVLGHANVTGFNFGIWDASGSAPDGAAVKAERGNLSFTNLYSNGNRVGIQSSGAITLINSTFVDNDITTDSPTTSVTLTNDNIGSGRVQANGTVNANKLTGASVTGGPGSSVRNSTLTGDGTTLGANAIVDHVEVAGGMVIGTGSTVSTTWIAGQSFSAGSGSQVQDSTVEGTASGQATYTSSIVGGCAEVQQSGGWNLDSGTNCGFAEPTDLSGTSPGFAYHGPWGTARSVRLPGAGSPAIDTGRPGCGATDVGGKPRPVDGDADGTSACDRGAVEVPTGRSLTLDVNVTNDEVDANVGDGLCATAGGTCSLRAAVTESNVINGSDVINLPSGATLTRAGSLGPLAISSAVVVNGNGSTLSIGYQGGGLSIESAAGSVSINDLTVAGAYDDEAIENGADLTLNRVTINSSWGTLLSNRGSLTATQFEFTGNSEYYSGPTHYAFDNYGTATFTDSTFGFGHSGIGNRGDLTLRRVTMSGLASGYALENLAGTAYLETSTVASPFISVKAGVVTLRDSTARALRFIGNVGGQVVARNSVFELCGQWDPVVSQGYNVTTPYCPVFHDPTDLQVDDLLLYPLADNGGLTQTRLPAASSPLVDSGDPNCLATDQRGVSRPQGSGCDRGAVET